MKKALRIIVPILLAIAVIACMLWYLFVYDREFTRDMLLQQARSLESKGQHTAAQWFYNTAYAHANNDETVAIELANQYKASGNYTKAEFTLSNAIADGGTAKLYMALCATYTEQDKILDAVSMLDSIQDAAIKAELDAIRPAAPIANPEPGFYSQYITVSFDAPDGTLYVSTDGQYPSTATDLYTEGFELPQGETTIYAVTIADNGLVSPLTIHSYTIGGIVEPVTFADPAVESYVRSLLNVGTDKVLYTNELWPITTFAMPQNAQTYADLQYLPYLESLTIQKANADELQYISSLENLKQLHIFDCNIKDSDVQTICNLPLLEKLTLSNCGISSIDELAAAQSLVSLNLASNSIRDISTFSNMPNLQELYLQENVLTDLSPLSNLSNLTKLNVSYNALTSIAPICTLQNLNVLAINNNSITDLAAINNLTALTHFSAGHNQLTDVSGLGSCTAIEELDLSYNRLSDVSALASMNALKNLDISYNQITSLPGFDESCALITIKGEGNLLTSLDPLGGLQSLNSVLMQQNTEIENIDALADCPKLVEVDVWGSKVKNVDSLLAQSVIVKYDPTLAKTG